MRKRSSMDPLFDEPQGPAWGRWVIGGGIVIVIGFIAYAAFRGQGDTQQGPVPIIRADETPWTRAPSEPGGMEIPNQDSTVFELMEEEAVKPTETAEGTAPVAGEETADKPVEGAADKAVDATVDTSEDKAEDKSLDQIVGEAMDKPVEDSADETVDEAVETAEETPAPEKLVEKVIGEEPVKKEETVAKKAAPEDEPYKPAPKSASTTTAPSTTTTAPAAKSGGGSVRVRLGSVPGGDTAKAANEFRRLQGLAGGKLSGASPSYEKVDLSGKGSFVRLNVSMDRASAQSLCDTLSAKGAPCLILAE